MAAYAALVSVMHIIDQLKLHPRPPISLNKNQVESLTQNVIFLQEFLESYAPTGENEGYDGLESRILDAAYAAEDVIESRVVDCILAGSANDRDEMEFGQRLRKVIGDMDLIKNEVVETREKMRVQHQLQKITIQRKSASYSSVENTTMVGFDDALDEMFYRLTGGESDFKFILIVGMGGIGKTTLARKVYEHRDIRYYFDTFVWVTISQECDVGNILDEILSQVMQDKRNSTEMNEDQIGYAICQFLYGRRYLIVIDDLWSIDVWRKIEMVLPHGENGSRVVVTTRLSNLARQWHNSYALHMELLDMDKSWDLFSQIVFTREKDYPHEMVDIGKKIVGKCKGHPLSITVVGCFLAKSKYTIAHWKHIEENLNSFVNSHNDDQCLNMLRLSYNQLPVHLKPCFLYMGVFEEDIEICASRLVKLWVAEGFVKPIIGGDMEEVAEEYLNDLADRNLIFIGKGRRNHVKIHDLIRNFCQRQAEAERFYVVLTQHSITIPHNQRRFLVCEPNIGKEVIDALQSMPLARSIISYDKGIYVSRDHRLLRISGSYDQKLFLDEYYQENKFQLVNLRYLFASSLWVCGFASSLHLLWSLQTLIINCGSDCGFTAPAEIWNMAQLRHVQIEGYIYLPHPPVCNGKDDILMENLQTLKLVKNFKWGKEVLKRIPNLKKLGLEYVGNEIEESCFKNLDCLHKLKSLKCKYSLYPEQDGPNYLQKLSFPRSLKKLALDADLYVHWEDMLVNIGSLPFLEKLKLSFGFFTTNTLQTIEGQFLRLKLLKLDNCVGLEYWNSERSHFPRLEHLVLRGLHYLNEIPNDIGEIPTLLSMELYHCSKSVVISCKRIQEELEFYGDECLQVRVQVPSSDYKALEHLASPNFKVISMPSDGARKTSQQVLKNK